MGDYVSVGDTAAQNVMAMAFLHKSAKTNFIASACSSFAKRMSYESAIFKIGHASLLGVIADMVRQKCLLGGIEIDVQKTPRAAFEDSFGKKCQGEVLKFGAPALLKLAVAATGEGAFATRTVRRASATDQVKADLVNGIKGAPWTVALPISPSPG
ncbi:unnamed protein product [Prorocentrum cordatum]|uniref:Uncharacterized protein n=1 Tax=Prorocentrum cordatum TaxID=2364126 RepID=A0ABN9TQ45_9DINO|nr:unnamed protein product [Polarella glacialis]